MFGDFLEVVVWQWRPTVGGGCKRLDVIVTVGVAKIGCRKW